MAFENDKTPHLLTIEELGAMLRLTKQSARLFVWRELVQVGGVVKIGGRLFVHNWAVNRWLEANKITPDNPRVVRAKETHAKNVARGKERYHSGADGRKRTGTFPARKPEKVTDEQPILEVPE